MPLIGVYYYPYYPAPKSEKWRGGPDYVEEWELLRIACKRFDRHTIRRPLVSLEFPDFADPSRIDIMERQIDLAADHGISLFIFNWYFDSRGRTYLAKPLRAFLRASNRHRLQFAINWCFSLPKRRLPHRWQGDKDQAWRAVVLSPEYFREVITILSKSHFSENNYWRINGRPALSMFNVKTLWEQPGMSTERLEEMFEAGRAAASLASEANPFFIGIVPNPDETCIQLAVHCPWDALTGYVYLPEFTSHKHIQDYQELIHRRLQDWQRFRKLFKCPWLPSVAAGWDASPRGDQGISWAEIERAPRTVYPWSPIVTGVTPKRFGWWLSEASRYLDETAIRPRVINIASWNEWTEGNAIEPSDLFGNTFLQQIKRFASRLQQTSRLPNQQHRKVRP